MVTFKLFLRHSLLFTYMALPDIRSGLLWLSGCVKRCLLAESYKIDDWAHKPIHLRAFAFSVLEGALAQVRGLSDGKVRRQCFAYYAKCLAEILLCESRGAFVECCSLYSVRLYLYALGTDSISTTDSDSVCDVLKEVVISICFNPKIIWSRVPIYWAWASVFASCTDNVFPRKRAVDKCHSLIDTLFTICQVPFQERPMQSKVWGRTKTVFAAVADSVYTMFINTCKHDVEHGQVYLVSYAAVQLALWKITENDARKSFTTIEWRDHMCTWKHACLPSLVHKETVDWIVRAEPYKTICSRWYDAVRAYQHRSVGRLGIHDISSMDLALKRVWKWIEDETCRSSFQDVAGKPVVKVGDRSFDFCTTPRLESAKGTSRIRLSMARSHWCPFSFMMLKNRKETALIGRRSVKRKSATTTALSLLPTSAAPRLSRSVETLTRCACLRLPCLDMVQKINSCIVVHGADEWGRCQGELYYVPVKGLHAPRTFLSVKEFKQSGVFLSASMWLQDCAVYTKEKSDPLVYGIYQVLHILFLNYLTGTYHVALDNIHVFRHDAGVALYPLELDTFSNDTQHLSNSLSMVVKAAVLLPHVRTRILTLLSALPVMCLHNALSTQAEPSRFSTLVANYRNIMGYVEDAVYVIVSRECYNV